MTGAGLPAELASGRAELHLLTDEDLARALRGAHHLVERLYGERFRRATAAEIREASNAHSSKGRPAPAPALRPWVTAECIGAAQRGRGLPVRRSRNPPGTQVPPRSGVDVWGRV